MFRLSNDRIAPLRLHQDGTHHAPHNYRKTISWVLGPVESLEAVNAPAMLDATRKETTVEVIKAMTFDGIPNIKVTVAATATRCPPSERGAAIASAVARSSPYACPSGRSCAS